MATRRKRKARPPGRPTLRSEQLVQTICSRLAAGESLRSICRDAAMPGAATVFRWLDEPEQADRFRERYARAREIGLELMADEILEIADDSSRDTRVDENGAERVDSEWVQRAKLRVDSRKWILSKQLPRKYGDASRLALGGDPDGSPVQLRGIELTDEERAARIHAILAMADARRQREQENQEGSDARHEER